MKLSIVQQRIDKHPTLAYEYNGRWHSYSNNKYLKWEPTDSIEVASLIWMEGTPLPSLRAKVYVVLSEEGDKVMAHWEGDDWFSQHTNRRLLVNVIRWAPVR